LYILGALEMTKSFGKTVISKLSKPTELLTWLASFRPARFSTSLRCQSFALHLKTAQQTSQMKYVLLDLAHILQTHSPFCEQFG